MSFRRFLTHLLLACAFFLPTLASADDISVQYEYKLDPQVDFSTAPKGALKVNAFTDARGAADARSIGEYSVEMPVTEMIHSALTQAFVAGGAGLVEEGQGLTLSGEVTEFSVADKDGEYDVTVRTHVTLRAGTRSAYDTVIFGRASAPEIEAAISAALDKLVHSLIWDDYFLLEVI